ncbi:MAG: UDP-N-acetylmuramoyl-tripeptide--D-alanyl-D-alanine ligase [Methylophilaceae bacterium]|nr:UDP-N-acetylmuramoyl-tripeptide--D-alanyl-D-alanine ligase [Methylophilaceae bacterium]
MMLLSEAAQATSGDLRGPDLRFLGVTTDSRLVTGGDLFVALHGTRFDGHDFVAQCFERGAVAAMVCREPLHGDKEKLAGSLLMVRDTRKGLGDLAAYWRGKFVIPLAAITGSNGKTTVKEMLANILRAYSGSEAVLATEGNLNNDIGLPLTLLKMRDTHRYAVAEMGMNHLGEIAYLTRIARPTVALVNNAQPAHLEGVGSVEAVARAKGEIFQGLTDDGTALINADDTFAPFWKGLAYPHRIMTFGLEQPADVSADYVLEPEGSSVQLKTPVGNVTLHLNVPGLHNVRNALAAAAAGLALGVTVAAIATGLEGFSGVRGRLQRKTGCCGCTLIDDSYNANPASMRAAISVLASLSGKKIFVMGDMGELGSEAAVMHAEIGAAAKEAGITALYALGEMTRHAVAAFGSGAHHFDRAEALAAELLKMLDENTVVLVKGSRFMRMERVVELLQKEKASCC